MTNNNLSLEVYSKLKKKNCDLSLVLFGKMQKKNIIKMKETKSRNWLSSLFGPQLTILLVKSSFISIH